MSTILAIDPGSTESGWCLIDAATRKPLEVGKDSNPDVRKLAYRGTYYDHAAVEMIASYGMPVGKEVFETCVWIGRFVDTILGSHPHAVSKVYRKDVKLNLCHDTHAKDSNVRQALVDRFAPGERNHGKGTKAEPGWFYGFRADIWQAYAVAVTLADRLEMAPLETWEEWI